MWRRRLCRAAPLACTRFGEGAGRGDRGPAGLARPRSDEPGGGRALPQPLASRGGPRRAAPVPRGPPAARSPSPAASAGCATRHSSPNATWVARPRLGSAAQVAPRPPRTLLPHPRRRRAGRGGRREGEPIPPPTRAPLLNPSHLSSFFSRTCFRLNVRPPPPPNTTSSLSNF